MHDFWQEVKRLKHSKSAKRSPSSVVDGLANTQDIANSFSNKLRNVLNSVKEDEESFSFLLDAGGTPYSLSVNTKTVTEALEKLKPNKQDGSQLASNHQLLAAPIIVEFLSTFFTVIIKHGYTVEPPNYGRFRTIQICP